MKKRICTVLLALCIVIGLLPMTALAEGNEIELSAVLTAIDGTTAASGTGWKFEVERSTLFVSEGYTVVDTHNTTCSWWVYNQGTISGGTYTNPVTNFGAITGGTFNNDGTVGSTLYNHSGGTISGGTFNCAVINLDGGTISGGTFCGNVTNDGTITGGTFAVSLKLNGGTISGENITSYTHGTEVPLPTDVTRDGFVFGGWYANSGFSGDPVTKIGVAETGQKTYYAKWISTNAGVAAVSVNGTAGTIVDTSISVVLPSGSTIPADSSAVSITPAAGAVVSGLSTSDSGETWTFTVTAEDGVTTENYTIRVTVDGAYDLWIGGVQVNENNKDNLADGKAVYNPDSNTLTLNGAKITGYYTVTDSWLNAGIYCKGDLKIVLTDNTVNTIQAGSDSIELQNSYALYGIYVGGNLTIAGGGSLTVSTADNSAANTLGVIGIHATNLTVGTDSDSPTVTVTAGGTASGMSVGIFASTMTVNSGTVTATGGEATSSESAGIYLSNLLELNSGNVTATGSTAKSGMSSGINAPQVTVMKSETGAVNLYAVGRDYGIYKQDISSFDSTANVGKIFLNKNSAHVILEGGTQAVNIAAADFSASGYYRTLNGGVFTYDGTSSENKNIVAATNTNTCFEYVSTSHLEYTDKKFMTHDFGCPDTCSLTKVTIKDDESHSYGSDGNCVCGKAKPGTAFSGGVIADKSDGVYTYGDTITITVNPVPSGDSDVTFVTGLSEKLALWLGNVQLTEAVVTENAANYTITYDTSHKGISVDDNTLTVKFAGNDYMSACEGLVNITLNAKELTVKLEPVDRAYEPGKLTVVVNAAPSGMVITADDVDVPNDGRLTGTMVDANAGENKAVTLPVLTLVGTDAQWYTLTQPSGVTVTITKANADDGMKTASGYLIKGSTSTVTLPELPINSNHSTPTFTAPIVSAAVNDGSLTVTGSAEVEKDKTYTVTIHVTGGDGCNYKDYDVTVTLTGTEHSHDWTYTASGDTITATCNNANTCPAAEQSITIFAVDKTYDGMAVTATVTNTVDSTDYSASVVYEAKTGSLTEGKAVNAGTYTAKITVGGVTASAEFTIDKAQLTITPKNYLLVEDSNAPDLTAADAYSVDGLAQGETISDAVNGTITLSYDKTPDMSEAGHYSINVNGDALTSDNYEIYCGFGTLEIVACIHQFENFALNEAGDSILATCANDCAEYKDPKGIVTIIAPENPVYEPGLWHTVSLMYHAQVELNSGDIVYSADPILPGTYTASITYGGVTASVTYTVAKRALTITADDQTVLVDGTPDVTKITAGGDGLAYDHTVTVTLKAVDTAAVGTKTLEIDTVTIEDEKGNDVTANYDITKVNGTLSVIVGHTVTVESADKGTVTADQTAVAKDDTVTLTVTPDWGYELKSLTVLGENDDPVTVTDNKFTMPGGDVTVTAEFKPIRFGIILRDSAKPDAKTKYIYGKYGDEIDLSAYSFSRGDNYTLSGWSSKGDGNGMFNFAADETIDADEIAELVLEYGQKEEDGYYYFAYLTAQWEGFYIVLRDSAEEDAETKYVWVTCGESLDMSQYSFSREGYTLSGWSSRGDGTGSVNCAVGGTISADDVKFLFGYAQKEDDGYYYFAFLTAQWDANRYTVKFDANGGTGTMADQAFAYGTAQDLNANAFAYSGHNFVSWNTKADGTGTPYSDGQSVSNLTEEANGVATLYAQWSKEPVYDVSGEVHLFDSSQPGHAIHVTIQKGSKIFAETETNDAGHYDLHGVPSGIYNIVAIDTFKGETRTTTAKVEVTQSTVHDGKVTVQELKLPEHDVSSELTVPEGTPDIVVGGLDAEASAWDDGNDGTHVTLSMTVAQKEDVTASEEPEDETRKEQQTAIKETAGSQKNNLTFLEITLQAATSGGTAGENSNSNSVVRLVTETAGLLELHVPFTTTDRESFKVYRYHGDRAETLKKDPAAGEEGYVVGKGEIIIYAKKFSVYAIGYTKTVYIPTYKITVENVGDGGTVKSNRTYVSSGSTVTLTVTVEDGCEMDSLTVVDSRGKEVALTDKGNGKYTFRMPSRRVTVAVNFHRCPSNSLSDVPRGEWYHEAIDYVLENSLMDAASETAFDRTSPATRATLVAALWRNESSPVVDYLMTYTDMDPEHEQVEAIRWATSVGIVNGFPDGTFHPDEAITREQMAAIFYRYEQYKGEGFSGDWEYELEYADADEIADWAYEAVCWNTLNGIVQGDGTNFDPKGTATRAHVAQILMNYIENK